MWVLYQNLYISTFFNLWSNKYNFFQLHFTQFGKRFSNVWRPDLLYLEYFKLTWSKGKMISWDSATNGEFFTFSFPVTYDFPIGHSFYFIVVFSFTAEALETVIFRESTLDTCKWVQQLLNHNTFAIHSLYIRLLLAVKTRFPEFLLFLLHKSPKVYSHYAVALFSNWFYWCQ